MLIGIAGHDPVERHLPVFWISDSNQLKRRLIPPGNWSLGLQVIGHGSPPMSLANVAVRHESIRARRSGL
jgi:hypothetical protein